MAHFGWEGRHEQEIDLAGDGNAGFGLLGWSSVEPGPWAVFQVLSSPSRFLASLAAGDWTRWHRRTQEAILTLPPEMSGPEHFHWIGLGSKEEFALENRERGNVCGSGRQIFEVVPTLRAKEGTPTQLDVQEKLLGKSPGVLKVKG